MVHGADTAAVMVSRYPGFPAGRMLAWLVLA